MEDVEGQGDGQDEPGGEPKEGHVDHTQGFGTEGGLRAPSVPEMPEDQPHETRERESESESGDSDP